MNYILHDGDVRDALLPFTFTRPVSEIRIGILTIHEKWEKYLATSISCKTEGYLSQKYPMVTASENVVINASFLPNEKIVESITSLKEGEAIFHGERVVAYYTKNVDEKPNFNNYQIKKFSGKTVSIQHTWDIFSKNAEALEDDFDFITKGRKSQSISKTNTTINPKRIFIEEGAIVECSILNASTGSIYIGKDAQVMEGCIIRGALALCDNAVLKMGAKIYGASTFGPFCKVGGEVNNSVLFAYSNKGHEGFLGNSVLGEWCNLGADTNTSNLKNNYAHVKLWDYTTESFAKTGLQFCGLMMGDQSKSGINTMFNTGTVVGVSANIFGSGFPRNFIPSFSWGGASGFTTYRTNKAFEAASAMMGRRNIEFDEKESSILEHVFELTNKWRNY